MKEQTIRRGKEKIFADGVLRREEKCDVIKIQICEIMGLDGIFRKNKMKKVPCQKSAF